MEGTRPSDDGWERCLTGEATAATAEPHSEDEEELVPSTTKRRKKDMLDALQVHLLHNDCSQMLYLLITINTAAIA